MLVESTYEWKNSQNVVLALRLIISSLLAFQGTLPLGSLPS